MVDPTIAKIVVLTTHAEPRVYADMVERYRVDVRAEISDCILHTGQGFDNLLEARAYASGLFDGRHAAGDLIRVVHRSACHACRGIGRGGSDTTDGGAFDDCARCSGTGEAP